MTEYRREVVLEGKGKAQYVRWLLHGPEGAIQFVQYISWFGKPPTDLGESEARVSAHDIGHHWRSPTYEGETVWADDCPYIHGACYYDGSSLNAETGLNILREEGVEAVWKWMETWYQGTVERSGPLLMGEIVTALTKAIDTDTTEETS